MDKLGRKCRPANSNMALPGKNTMDAIIALRMMIEKYREGQKELHYVFIDLEKAYDRVPRQKLWHCMRQAGVTQKYIRVVQNMYTGCEDNCEMCGWVD